MPILVASAPTYPGPFTPGTLLQASTVQLGAVLFGVVDDVGSELVLTGLSDWFSTGTTGEATQRVGADGAWLSRANRPPRLPTVTATIIGGSRAQALRSLDAIVGAVPIDTPTTLMVATAGYPAMQADVRLSGDILVEEGPYWLNVSIPLVAPDPLRYSIDQGYFSLTLPSTTGGLTLPFTVPFAINATVTEGQMALANAGNAAMFPVWRITGPVTSPVLTNATTGQRWSYLDTIEAGHYLDIDFGRRTALLDGQAPRLGRTDGEWWPLLPGDNTVQFGSSVGSIDARAEIWWRSAWL